MATGKWKQPGVPHKGWICTGYDTYENYGDEVCEMCESEPILHYQTMEHPDYAEGPLQCGKICAGNMSEDKKGADERYRETVNANERKKTKIKQAAKKREKLEKDYADKELKKAQELVELKNTFYDRFDRWVDSPLWVYKDNGNMVIRSDWGIITIYENKRGNWGFYAGDLGNEHKGVKWVKTAADAQNLVFNLMEDEKQLRLQPNPRPDTETSPND